MEINVRNLWFFIFAFALVYLAALPLDVMDVDAAQYASISQQMLKTHSWLQVMDRGHDYLDKPPLLFWLAASSFKIFGISNWAYKLPSFLFALLGIFSTVKLTELLYDKKTGVLAGLMLASGLAVFIMVNDVRTDTLLLGSVAFSVWQILLYLKTKRWISLVAGFAGVGAAMLAKGPLGLVIPVLALSSEFAYKRQWKNFVRWQWLVGLVIVAIILFPMCLGLYRQFDLHPEKTVNGATGVSGLRFYFWTQSFGRITGESDWGTKFDNGAGPFFFVHTFLWAFFPWSFLVIGGVVKTFLKLVKSRFRPGYLPELLSAGGFVLVFLALSASKYKLPHYIYVTLPFAAMIAARFFIYDVFHLAKRYLKIIYTILHGIFIPALFAVVALILFFIFPGKGILPVVLAGVLFVTSVILLWKLPTTFEKLLYPLLLGLLAFFFTGFTVFYPGLLSYQAPAIAGKKIAAENPPKGAYANFHDVFRYANDFYSGRSVMTLYVQDGSLDSTIAANGYCWLFTDKDGLEELKNSGYKIQEEEKIPDYSIQFITMNFLNPATRESVLRERFLLRVNK
jgi:4-amino-4-deoxy-L-arabinose transferase-like glycosyltransferase